VEGDQPTVKRVEQRLTIKPPVQAFEPGEEPDQVLIADDVAD
jgi:hypothetical protein